MPKQEKIFIAFLWIVQFSCLPTYLFIVGQGSETMRWSATLAAPLIIFGVSWCLDKLYNRQLARANERAELAESHIEELRSYVTEQESVNDSLRKSKEKYRHAALHDSLTKLPNRNLFLKNLKFQLDKRQQTDGYEFGVAYLDLNRFKNLNESLGHATADKLILHVARRLSNLTRGDDLVAHFGGDKFAVILSDINSAQDAADFAVRVQKKLTESFLVSGQQVYATLSIGIAYGGTDDYNEAEEVLRDAEIAMYRAKEQKEKYKIFDKLTHTRAISQIQVETDLRHAIERKQFTAYYQPIVDLDSMRLSGFESLIRWNHPERGLVAPGEFIPVSEETGLIVPITLWMMRQSCRQLVSWQKQHGGLQNLFVSVNLSGKHFTGENLVQQIGQIIFDTGIDPGCLKLEITESAVMENPEEVISMLVQLKSLGVLLSIDDFGTGYSSLSYLHRFPVDTLKVDRSFVNAMDEGSENGEIIRTVVSLANTLRMNVIAEGVETMHQLHQLRVLGCEYAQGYLFSRPVPAEEAEKLFEDRERWKNILPASQAIPPKQDSTHLRLAK